MFIDVASIWLQAGRGGDGKVSFHREKYVAAGGPDGGDGGRGGSIIFQVDDNLSTLMDFRYQRKYKAEPGQNGGGGRRTGKDGQDLIIRVPRGTVIRDKESGGILHDMSDDAPFVAARGGNGGWGNCHFATATRQAPRFARPGQPGQQREVTLELKLLADVGLVGFPNVGKSTLLSRLSAARPKIANYHFTTLTPNLGVVRVDEGCSFVLADIPGIIEGAAQGVGLGHDFLRHIDRCRLLVHLVDAAGSEGRDPVADFDAINQELKEYSEELAQRPQLVVANKIDLAQDGGAGAQALEAAARAQGWDYAEISAVTGQGIQPLLWTIWDKLQALPPVRVYEEEYVEPEPQGDGKDIAITRGDDGSYQIESEYLARLLAQVDPNDYESRQYMERVLRQNGVFDRLEQMGIEEGDTVMLMNFAFEYVY